MANTPIVLDTVIREVEFDPTSGWYAVITDDGKLTTKRQDLATQALSLKDKSSRVFGQEQIVSKPAPDGSGMRTYRNRYFDRAEETNGFGPNPVQAAQAAQAAAAGGFTTIGGRTPEQQQEQFAAPTPQERSKTNKEDAWRMALTSGSERAVQTLPLMPNEQRTFEIQKSIAMAWAKFIFFTPVPTSTVLAQQGDPPTPEQAYAMPRPFAGQGPGTYDEPGSGHETPPPHTDDDIPY